MNGLADDDDQSRGYPADMVATAERHGPDQQDTAKRQNDDLENGEAANILERVESINKTHSVVAVTEEQHGVVAVTEEQRGADAVTEEQLIRYHSVRYPSIRHVPKRGHRSTV